MIRYIGFVLRYRRSVLAAFGGVSLFFGYFALQAEISSTPREMFFGNAPIFNRYMARNQAFGGDHIAIIGLQQPSVILTLGFVPFSGADYFSVRIFGTLLPLAFMVALAADLLLVPAMVQLGWIRFPRTSYTIM